MDFNQAVELAVKIRKKYDKLNRLRGVTWNESDLMAGFVGDVGDLSKLIMAKNGLRKIENFEEKLSHELCDCLWSILVLADKLDVDLESEFKKAMSNLGSRRDKELED